MATALNIRPTLEKLKARLKLLTAGLILMDVDSAPAALGVYLYSIPNALLQRDNDPDTAHEYPYLVIRPVAGDDGMQSGSLRVRCFVGLFNPGENFEGEDDLESVAAAILRLSDEQDYAPYALEPDIKFQLGGEKNGAQEVDKFYMTADLILTREALFTNY